MSFVLLGILNSQAAAQGFNYWWSLTLSDVDDNLFGQAHVSPDSDGFIYKLLQLDATGGFGLTDGLFIKQDKNGEIIFSKLIGDSENNRPRSMTKTSDENFVYSEQFALAKLDSDGQILITRVPFNPALFNDVLSSVVELSGGNIAAVSRNSVGDNSLRLYILNSNLVLQNVRELQKSNRNLDLGFAAATSSNEVVIAGTGFNLDNVQEANPYICKFNSSGTLIWQRFLIDNSDGDQVNAVAVDSNNDIYAVGGSDSQVGAIIFKYSSSGVLQWQKIVGSAVSTEFQDIFIDTDDNIYVGGNISGGFILIKFDTNGNIIWQRRTNYLVNTPRLTVDFEGNPIISFNSNRLLDSYSQQTLKLPPDGSGTGTYNIDNITLIYSASSLAISNSTFTPKNGDLDDNTFPQEETSLSYNSSNYTVNNQIAGIG